MGYKRDSNRIDEESINKCMKLIMGNRIINNKNNSTNNNNNNNDNNNNSNNSNNNNNIIISELQDKSSIKKYYCYILQQINVIKSLNYVGYTVNCPRRLRQHCGDIKGGAIYTKNRGPWEYLAVLHCCTWNNIRALQVEWLIKHPTRKRKRPTRFSGSVGRIKSLEEIFNRIPIEEQINIYIHPDFQTLALSLPLKKNITICHTITNIS